MLTYRNGQLFLKDQGSRNGTKLNGDEIGDDELRVRDKDIIEITGEKFQVELAD